MHAHIILFLSKQSKVQFRSPSHVDEDISAEIPSKTDPTLREAVLLHMIHRPCNRISEVQCLRDGKCSKRFPKHFQAANGYKEGDYYVSYKRRVPKVEKKQRKFQ